MVYLIAQANPNISRNIAKVLPNLLISALCILYFIILDLLNQSDFTSFLLFSSNVVQLLKWRDGGGLIVFYTTFYA